MVVVANLIPGRSRKVVDEYFRNMKLQNKHRDNCKAYEAMEMLTNIHTYGTLSVTKVKTKGKWSEPSPTLKILLFRMKSISQSSNSMIAQHLVI